MDGLIDNSEWKEKRLLPLASRGDKQYAGNRHFTLSPDGRNCTFSMLTGRVPSLDKKGRPKVGKDGTAVQKLVWETHTLELSRMSGNQGEILRQAAQLAADKQINVMFRIDGTHLHVTVDPMDLPDHPERRRPVKALPGRAIGVDLNP